MSDEIRREVTPITGIEYRPALAKLVLMMIGFALMVPAGAFFSICWWLQIPFINGKVLSTTAGIVSLLAMPMGSLLFLVPLFLILSAKRLVIGADRIQLLSRDNVAVQIPFHNVVETYFNGEGNAGVVGLRLRDRNNPETIVPSWTKDRYEIQVLTYGKTLQEIYNAVTGHFHEYRSKSD
jgi:hypothetical protein